MKNEPLAPLLTALVIFAAFLDMPLLLAIAGFAIGNSLGRRSVGEFMKERSRWLLLPFMLWCTSSLGRMAK